MEFVKKGTMTYGRAFHIDSIWIEFYLVYRFDFIFEIKASPETILPTKEFMPVSLQVLTAHSIRCESALKYAAIWGIIVKKNASQGRDENLIRNYDVYDLTSLFMHLRRYRY